MRSKFKWIFTLLLAFSMQFSFAQEKTITGTVTESGLPLPGVTVKVQGKTAATQTDFDGNFSISAAQGDVLEFSFVGLETKTAVVGASNVVNTAMVAGATTLDDVLVVGYFTQKKEDVTAAVSTVGSDEIAKMAPSMSLDNMLQGKAAGVQVVGASGRPGQPARVAIRGINQMDGNNANPLYVVDGVYMSSTEMLSINPADIENQVVLKDAAATALYGSRGANGVIVVTTKRAKKGVTQFQLNTSYGFSDRVDDNFDIMNASQYLAHEQKLREAGVQGLPIRTPEQIAFLSANGEDWEKQVFKKGILQNVQFQALSATENTNFLASFGYDKNTGLINPWNGFDRLSGRIKVDQKMKHNITIGGNVNLSYTKDDRPRESFNVLSPVFTAYGNSPLVPKYAIDPTTGEQIVDENGNPVFGSSGLPSNLNYFEIYEDDYSIETRQIRTFGNVYAQIDDLFTDGLSFKTEFNAVYGRSVNETFVAPGSNISNAFGYADLGLKSDGGSDSFDYRWVHTLRYNTTIADKHNLDVIVFNEYNKYNFYSYFLESQGFPNSFLTVQSVAGQPTDATTSRTDYLFIGYGANVLYDFDNKYFLQASLRRDEGSMFGRQDNVGYFPGASVGWKISEESFMDNAEFVNNLKLRASWGKRGSNSGLAQNYPQTAVAFPGYNNIPGAAPTSAIANPFLQWSVSETYGAGLDFTLFNRRLTGTVDYFKDIRTNFYFQDVLPFESGAYTQEVNAGEFYNQGWEFALSYDLISNENLVWNIKGNLTLVKNKVTDLYNLEEKPVGGHMNVVGGMVNEYFEVRYAGVNPANGEPLYYTPDGGVTNVFNGELAVRLEDKTPAPTYFGGFGTSVNWKNLDFSADFSYQGGNYIYNVAELVLLDPTRTNQNFRTDASNFWTAPGQTGVLPRPINDDGTRRTLQGTDQFLHKGDFLRFRSLNIGYTFGKDVFGESFMERVRVYVSGQNLYTWTKFKGDPEVGFMGLESTGTFVGSAYRWAYPNAQTYMFGVQLTF
ncbi:SusC/RagA family TonB-linked outer membrane protein [Flavobacterium sp. NST-5]|uniref:SusC/RagA family TonB-linked outer membrane protein n=1 Tax=Flavobacterium ichthyis TaxID=2698827 RepID=A0ABW9Z6C3_9FLAO|nr:SusC/RagA family TonB-linked outer membrane protein [Flavobacterium ichthyis]NBL64401.1 SusC/RagA family TonB-linked outer membrane protein [Flavobacterium ichthyis]